MAVVNTTATATASSSVVVPKSTWSDPRNFVIIGNDSTSAKVYLAIGDPAVGNATAVVGSWTFLLPWEKVSFPGLQSSVSAIVSSGTANLTVLYW